MVSIQIENVDNEVGEGSQHGDDGEGDGLGTGDGRGIALVLVGRDVHDVVLFEIVVGELTMSLFWRLSRAVVLLPLASSRTTSTLSRLP